MKAGKSVRFSREARIFHGRTLPEAGSMEGYAALIEAFNLEVPLPDVITFISTKNRKYRKEGWNVLTPRHKPEDNLYKQLVFALKYEGINLLVLKKLFGKLSEAEMEAMLQLEPAGRYSRKIWFLYEWLIQEKLAIPDADTRIKYESLVDEKLQYAIQQGHYSARHRIINNLPGTVDYCPLIRKTEKLEKYLEANLAAQKNTYLKGIHKDILQRAAAFLLLKDSRASFTIEGESPKSSRAARWGQAIGQAGAKDLSIEELIRLQQLVIESNRFLDMGFRRKGGFVGEHDRTSGEPLPDHISARWQDVDQLIEGLLSTSELLISNEIDAVLAATVVAFGFVFIHPFEDGNGRVHRYLIHHMLAQKGFVQQGLIFPVSASILDHIDDYRRVLEKYSHPLLDFIVWKETADHNVEVLNETIDYYRYFDATAQAEFLYDCVNDTIERIIPAEVFYLTKYDAFKRFLDEKFEMPDKMVAMLVRFLEQHQGKISKRAREKEFTGLTYTEAEEIESRYRQIFME
ncbi:Fic family protein [Nafulsella turpanensis]|uniref:Fic family protein n=1 Tax=Nafulsella turpanensis TaxID=1265690 RepID=UPI00034A524E|nr:Fic family protein [Nafulsella turpanensis]